jgi:hypothetical protein
VVTLFTTCGAAVPLLLPKPPLPVKEAVMVWLPTLRVEVENDAWPLVLTVTLEAKTVAPSANVTEPAGVPPVEVMVAVKVTDVPEFDGFGVEVTLVEVVKLVALIVCVSVELVLFCHNDVPVKLATIEWPPVASDEVLNVATPEALTATFVARAVAPSVKVTLPAGVPLALVTVAVKVTLCPCDAGFAEELSAVAVAAGATTLCVRLAVLGVPDAGVKVVLIEWLPVARALVVNVATPLVTATPLARTVLPSLNDAVPVAEFGETVSVNVTLWPTAAGFADEAIETVGFTGPRDGKSGNVALV